MFLNNLTKLNLAAVIAISIVLISCQGNKKSGEQEQAAGDTLNKEEIAQDVKEVVYPLPTPFEMTKMLNEIGAKYIGSALNPANKAEKYFTEKSKAINLGIYAADVAYCATYDKKQETQNYLKALKTLVDGLGISIDYSKMLTEEFKEKVNNKDTLTKVITNTIYDTYQFLNEKNNPDLAVMMVSGMWIELMYIATHISTDTYDNTGMVQIIAKQKDSLTKLLEILAQRNSNADIKSLESELQVLKPVYDKVDQGLMKEDYQLILKTIEKVRNSLVS
jgi:predicted outer membrane protein